MTVFATAAKERNFYREMEVAARRKAGAGVIHPDQCPKLALRGAAFAIPPRGGRMEPVFAEDGTVTTAVREDLDWPELKAFCDAMRAKVRSCPQCHQPLPRSGDELEIEMQAAWTLARRALLVQYDLSAGQLQELLSFSPEVPGDWLRQLARWSLGLDPNEDPLPEDVLGELDATWDTNVGVPDDDTSRRWWQFWKRGH